jgi:GNAT superfamily N-acetyltransferase
LDVSTVQIREADLGDMGAIQDIYTRASLSNDGDRPQLEANPDALVFSDESVRQGRTQVAQFVDSAVVGFVTTEVREESVELIDLFVDPAWMRHGIGRQLIRVAASTARLQGWTVITVIANGHAMEFYESVGFVLDDTVETQFGPGFRMHLDL